MHALENYYCVYFSKCTDDRRAPACAYVCRPEPEPAHTVFSISLSRSLLPREAATPKTAALTGGVVDWQLVHTYKGGSSTGSGFLIIITSS